MTENEAHELAGVIKGLYADLYTVKTMITKFQYNYGTLNNMTALARSEGYDCMFYGLHGTEMEFRLNGTVVLNLYEARARRCSQSSLYMPTLILNDDAAINIQNTRLFCNRKLTPEKYFEAAVLHNMPPYAYIQASWILREALQKSKRKTGVRLDLLDLELLKKTDIINSFKQALDKRIPKE